MALLFFWIGKYYYKDMKLWGKTYALNQNNELMNRINNGEHIWAFTRRKNKRYVLALDLYVTNKSINSRRSQDYKYGLYHVDGDHHRSRYFNIQQQSNDIEPIIKDQLSVTANANILGNSFQGKRAVRQLTHNDELILTQFSRNLTLV